MGKFNIIKPVFYLKFFVNFLLLFTFPSFVINPQIEARSATENKPISHHYLFSFDEILNFIE